MGAVLLNSLSVLNIEFQVGYSWTFFNYLATPRPTLSHYQGGQHHSIHCSKCDQILNPIQDRLFRGCSRMGGGGRGLKSVAHILQWRNLPKGDPKNIWITWHTPWVLLTSAFFLRKSANFAISRNTNIDCILIHNFYLFWLFLGLYRLL